MKITTNILLQCLAALLLAFSATAATPESHSKSAIFDGELANVSVEAKACLKLKAPERHKQKCQGAWSYAPASSRPRSQPLPELGVEPVDQALVARRPALLVSGIDGPRAAPPGSGRASFWQVYAYSLRLRR